MKADYITAFGRFIPNGFVTVACTWNPIFKYVFKKIGNKYFSKVASTNTWPWWILGTREFYSVKILSARVLIPFAPIINFTIKAVVIPKVLRPCGENKGSSSSP